MICEFPSQKGRIVPSWLRAPAANSPPFSCEKSSVLFARSREEIWGCPKDLVRPSKINHQVGIEDLQALGRWMCFLYQNGAISNPKILRHDFESS